MEIENKTKLVKIKNRLKSKAGEGGFREEDLKKAQHAIDNNDIDFTPVAKRLLEELKSTLAEAKMKNDYSTQVLDALKTPILQLKAQGSMFHFPVYTDISSDLLRFLEKVDKIDSDLLNIVTSFYNTVKIIHQTGIKDSSDKIVEQLNAELKNVYIRYLNQHK